MRSLALIGLLAGACGDDDCTPRWEPVFHDDTQLDRSVLSVWGMDDQVHIVGGGLGVAGIGALWMYWDGAAWVEIETGRSETLWWVWGSSTSDVWAVGEGGVVLRWDGASVTEVDSGTDGTLFGVWGSSPDDVWIVGGIPGPDETPDDLVLHWDGASVTPDPTAPTRNVALFKIWGAAADDVWISGEAGSLYHLSGGAWTDHSGETDTLANLFTVHGCGPDDVWVVGGQNVIHWDGTAISHVTDAETGATANGVACSGDQVLIVGAGGLKLHRTGDAEWVDDTLVEPSDTDYHGAWISEAGDLWAVGGNFLYPPSVGERTGVVGARTCGAF